MSRSKQGIKNLESQQILAIKFLLSPLAKGDDTRLIVTVGIIKDILEAQKVAGRIV